MRLIVFTILVSLYGYRVQAQDSLVNTAHTLTSAGKVIVDGNLTEPVWLQKPLADGFLRNFPDNNSAATYTTEVWICRSEENLYVAAKMHRNPASSYSIQSLQRDFVLLENDAFGIIIDPFRDKTNGYGFYVNAGGAWRDEQISQGTIANAAWDTRWLAEVKQTPEYWTAEFEIPFKYFRNKGGTEWNLNFVRTDKGANERSSLHRVPINFLLHNLAFTNTLVWSQPVQEHKKNISLIPGVTFTGAQETGKPTEGRIQPSLDAKIALSSSVNVDVTINPDFSQTNADVFQLNLTRFELVYPENRLFFVENSDLFANFGDEGWGNPVVRPFYSRRIGLKFDERVGGYVPSQIIGGSRLSGKINNNFRFGAMTVFTEGERITRADTAAYSPAQNYSVVAAQQKIFSRSNISMMVANRQAFGTDESDKFAFNDRNFNRVAALEYNFASPNDKLSGKLYHHVEWKDNNRDTEFARGALFNHNSRHWRNWFHFTHVSDNYSPETGLISRNNVKDVNIHLAYSFYPKKGFINQVELIANQHNYWNNQNHYTDYFNISGVHAILKNTHDFWLVSIFEKNTLRAPFDPSFNDIQELDSGFVDTFAYGRLSYASDKRKEFYWQVAIDYGKYYLGSDQSKVEAVLRYRFQPYVNIGVSGSFVQYRMPEPYRTVHINYVGPRVDVTFHRNLYWTSLIQYNSLYHNLNIYSRIQWRFRPLSDLFVIYSNSSDTQLQVSTHNVSVKASFWF